MKDLEEKKLNMSANARSIRSNTAQIKTKSERRWNSKKSAVQRKLLEMKHPIYLQYRIIDHHVGTSLYHHHHHHLFLHYHTHTHSHTPPLPLPPFNPLLNELIPCNIRIYWKKKRSGRLAFIHPLLPHWFSLLQWCNFERTLQEMKKWGKKITPCPDANRFFL